MTTTAGHGSRGRLWALVPTALCLVVLCAVALVGCADATPVADRSPARAQGAVATLQSADVVDLTVYLRRGAGEGAHLVPVTRDVPLDGAAHLPRRAVELLLAGPEPDDGAGLHPPLPTSTAVRDVTVRGSVAHVDLSSEVVRDRASVGASADHELLGLAALANTLTEFPEIDHVDLTVDGRRDGAVAGVDVGDFWGWWGLPARLDRDESVIGPSPDGQSLPDLDHFSSATQTVGADGSGPVDLVAVRHRSRATVLRVSVELDDPARDDDAPVEVPATSARATPDGVLLEIARVGGIAAEVPSLIALDGRPFAGVSVESDTLRHGGPRSSGAGESVRILVRSGETSDFHLHTMTNPARVVLDLRT